MVGDKVYSGSLSRWTQCGTTSGISSSGQFATFSSITYPTKALFAPRSYTKAPVRIDYNAHTSALHTDVPDYNTSLKCTVQHGNRALLSTKSTIYYSAVGDYWTDLDGTNYVTVGQNDENITGLINMSGNLYIFKENCVWVKIGWQSAFDDYSFRLLFDVESCCDQAACLMSGAMVYANLSGVYVLSGDQSVCISRDIEDEWRTRANAFNMYVSYWPLKKWIFAEPDAQCTNGPLVYDVQEKKWFPFFGVSLEAACTTSNPQSSYSFVSASASKIQFWNDAGAAETTIEQYLKTARFSFATPHGTQYLSRVFLYGQNITTLKVYLYTSYEKYTTITKYSPNPVTVFDLPPSQEMEIECIGTGTMVLDSIAVECYTRRLK
ncbi:MAG: hypothetical protein BWY74_03826 [Firmicutes bacterium ADurb.Bin419]|nr:MAG: hypothetical protein BWY74_03826 [Firmicutes bacterium ADurb.Bin419]